MPMTIINGRWQRFFYFLICEPYNIPFLHNENLKSHLKGEWRRCRAEGPREWKPQQTAGGVLPQRKVKVTHSRDPHPHIWFLVILLPSFPGCISVLLCIKYEHLKHTTNICKPVLAMSAPHNDKYCSKPQVITSSRLICTERSASSRNGRMSPLMAMVSKTFQGHRQGRVGGSYDTTSFL